MQEQEQGQPQEQEPERCKMYSYVYRLGRSGFEWVHECEVCTPERLTRPVLLSDYVLPY